MQTIIYLFEREDQIAAAITCLRLIGFGLGAFPRFIAFFTVVLAKASLLALIRCLHFAVFLAY
jgi:hypothetical protein